MNDLGNNHAVNLEHFHNYTRPPSNNMQSCIVFPDPHTKTHSQPIHTQFDRCQTPNSFRNHHTGPVLWQGGWRLALRPKRTGEQIGQKCVATCSSASASLVSSSEQNLNVQSHKMWTCRRNNKWPHVVTRAISSARTT